MGVKNIQTIDLKLGLDTCIKSIKVNFDKICEMNEMYYKNLLNIRNLIS